MQKHLVHLLFIASLVTSSRTGWSVVSLVSSNLQSGCVEQIVGDAKIMADHSLDVNQDGELDRIVLYGRDDLHILVTLYQSPTICHVVLNEYLTSLVLHSPTEWRTVKIREIKMIELTGDYKPELYVWIEKRGGGSRYSYAIHTIYTMKDRYLQNVLDVALCLPFNTFEFRDSSTADTKDIYLETDRQCDPPWSSQRAYSIMKWDGSRFTSSETGTIYVQTTNPPWWNAFCVSTVVCSTAVLVLLAAFLINRKITRKLKSQMRKS